MTNYRILTFAGMPMPAGALIWTAEKKIGVKYCGGCNQTYDRVGMVDQVRSNVEDRFIVSCRDTHDIDVLVCVNGCSRACADAVSNKTNGSRPAVPTRSIVDENEFGNLIEWLSGFDKNGD